MELSNKRARECVVPVLMALQSSNQTVAEEISTMLTVIRMICDKEGMDFEEILSIGIQTDREHRGFT